MKKAVIILILIGILFYFSCAKVANPEYNIDGSSCNSCGRCFQVCPVNAIEFGIDGKAIIDQTKCTQCGYCVKFCPKGAIY